MGESDPVNSGVLQRGINVIRAVPAISRYIPQMHRLSSDAFTNSGDGSGVSVFDESCAITFSGSICAHIEKHYLSKVNDPPAYLRIPCTDLPTGHSLIPDSSAGDQCHMNVAGVRNNALRTWFRDFIKRDNVHFWCDGLESKPYSSPDG